MESTPLTKAGVDAPTTLVTLGRERLLGIPDICELTGLGEATAAKLMKESGRAIRLHRRIYVLETSFFAFLHELEVSDPCSL